MKKLERSLRIETAYEVWKILENSFTKGKEQLKSELKEKLEKLKFDTSVTTRKSTLDQCFSI
ncbi:hypothetical protein BCR32DRAFT_284197 [Anaeromyces robustus]|uniref:Uncharacterized protein n=1 Tax=Anaeromyces robustus TaxID=1754192 RepID=A0A1Y1WT56_9FUNG|nr:hypothetical protein BCR32DRAFT_284197 [Anaeromyces robustus]|eukprot:ORX76426.1 hypothetical protein BCR32DRAFT_284197 [Anaeromyces robustus]